MNPWVRSCVLGGGDEEATFHPPELGAGGADTGAQPDCAGGGGGLGVPGGDGGRALGARGAEGATLFVLPVSRDVHPPVLKVGATPLVDDVDTGGDGWAGGSDIPDVRVGSLAGSTVAQPGREGPAAGVEDAPTVAHPDF